MQISEKKYELPLFLIPQNKIAKMTAKMTMRHFRQTNELIGYQNSQISVKLA